MGVRKAVKIKKNTTSKAMYDKLNQPNVTPVVKENGVNILLLKLKQYMGFNLYLPFTITPDSKLQYRTNHYVLTQTVLCMKW